MAFFMVMWLVASVTKEQRAAIFDYFKNPSMEQGKSVKPSPGQMGPGGASTSVINMGGGLDARQLGERPVDGYRHPGEQRCRADTGAGSSGGPHLRGGRSKLTEAADHKKLESLMAGAARRRST